MLDTQPDHVILTCASPFGCVCAIFLCSAAKRSLPDTHGQGVIKYCISTPFRRRRLTQLQRLSLQSNRLECTEGLSACTSLEELYLSHNAIPRLQAPTCTRLPLHHLLTCARMVIGLDGASVKFVPRVGKASCSR